MSVTPATASKPSRRKADASLALAALLWGVTFVVVKGAVRNISTMYFLALRFGLGSMCMFILFRRALQRGSRAQLWRGFRGGALAGIFLWLGYTFQTQGLRYTSAGNSGFITGLYIVLVPILSALIYRRWPRILEVAGIAIAGTGMVFLTWPSFGQNLHLNRGDALTMACAVAYSFHLMLLGYFSPREHFEAVALAQLVMTALLSALSLLVDPPQAAWSLPLGLAVIGTGIFATAATFALQTWAQQYTTATRTALILALEPVFALLTAVAIGGESVTWFSVVGGSLILAGVVIVEIKPRELKPGMVNAA